jgi:hypothetical protein
LFLPAPSEGGSYTPPPVGTHLALCYRIIDLGTQKTTYNGETKTAHKLMISWELPQERMDDGRPFAISKRYTWSMHEKSTLRKDLEAWRGLAFSERDFGPSGFDIRNILGKACLLGVVHKETPEGKVFANVVSVGKPMKGVAIPTQTENPTAYFWLHPDRWDAAVFNGLGAGLQEVIRGAPEYHEMVKKLGGGGDDHHGLPEQTGSDFHDDDVPF